MAAEEPMSDKNNMDRSVANRESQDQTRPLGRTGIRIAPIGLGAWQFSEGKGGARGSWSPLTPETTDEIVRTALEAGINWFDTAELYGFGRSERGLSRALQKAGKEDGDIVMATKWNPLLRTARSITKTIEKRLEALSPFSIDLHQVHFPASFSSIESEMHAMADLIEAGKIRAAGVSNFSARQMRRAHEALISRGFLLASNQVKYSILDRKIESNGILDTARTHGITIIAYSPLEMGLLSGKFHKDSSLLRSRPMVRRSRLKRMIETSRPVINALEEIAMAHSATVSQVALNWLVNFYGESVVTIPGATKPHHARESAGALEFTLSRADMERIDELSRCFL